MDALGCLFEILCWIPDLFFAGGQTDAKTDWKSCALVAVLIGLPLLAAVIYFALT